MSDDKIKVILMRTDDEPDVSAIAANSTVITAHCGCECYIAPSTISSTKDLKTEVSYTCFSCLMETVNPWDFAESIFMKGPMAFPSAKGEAIKILGVEVTEELMGEDGFIRVVDPQALDDYLQQKKKDEDR